MQNQVCYERDALQSWLDGSSDPNIGVHVRVCDACQRTLDELCDIKTVQFCSSAAQVSVSYADDPTCRAVVERAKAIDVRSAPETHSSRIRSTPSTNTDSNPSKVGQEIGHYRIVRELGHGGMSIVYEAIDLHMDRSVAIKFMRGASIQDVHDIARFLREAKAAANIRHPNVVTVYDVQFDPEDGLPYLVMEYVPGPTLQFRIMQGPTIPLPTAVTWIASIAEGLHAAHELGVVHRDIKPSNILLEPGSQASESQADAWTPKLADFGLAQTDNLDVHLTRSGFLTGTPAYASPEQARSERASKQSDIYSLGVTLFETLTRETPFRGSTLAVLRQISESEFPSPRMLNPAVPIDVETICLKACNQQPSLRYASAKDLAADLQRWIAGEPILARPVSAWERLVRWTHRNNRVAGLLFAVMSLLAILAIGGLFGSLWMAKAKRDLADRAIQADTAKQTAELATLSAEKQRVAAMAQRKVAVESLNALVGQVQNRLSSRPGNLALREELLQVALHGFENVLQLQNQSDIDETMIDAQVQLASIYSALGKKKEATETIEKAIAAAESATEQQPGPTAMTAELASALATHADFKLAEFAHEQAKPLYERARTLFEQTSQTKELSLDKLRVRWQCRLKLNIVAVREKRFDDAIRDLESMRGELETLWETYPDNLELRRLRVSCLNLLATAYASIQSNENYRERLEDAIRLLDELRQMDPQHQVLASDAAVLQGKLSRLERETGNLDKAVQTASIAVDRVLEYAAMDKTNLNAQSMVGTIYDVQYEAYLHRGQLEEAAIATHQGFEAHHHVLTESPQSFRHIALAGESAAKLADVYLRQRKYPESLQWLARSAEIIERYRNLPPPVPVQAEAVALGYVNLLEAIQFATDRSAAMPSEFLPPEKQLYAWSMRAYVKALEGSTEDMEKSISMWSAWKEKIDDATAAANPLIDHSEAMIIRSLLIASHSDASEKTQNADSYRSRALETARKCVAAKPDLLAAYRNEPDMASIRDQVKQVISSP